MATKLRLVVFGIAAAAVVYADRAADCDLTPWVSSSPAHGGGEDGFHVICARRALGDTAVVLLDVHRGGVLASLPLDISVDVTNEDHLRAALQERLRFRRTIEYRVRGQPAVKWRKQPWTLFTVEGQELVPGSETAHLLAEFSADPRPVVLLLFEGGAWRWPTIEVGYTRTVSRGVQLRTVSRQPALFEVVVESGTPAPGREEELHLGLLDNAVKLAAPRMAPSQTEGKVIKEMRSSEQTFVDYRTDHKLSVLRTATARLLRMPEENFEHLQVLRYNVNQHYDAHRDYWDPREFPDVPRFTNAEGFWGQRHVTLLWFLAAPEAGGETWFPRAHGGPIPYGEWMACDSRGAKVSPANATAVLFYNLRADGDIDEFSWHSGCPVKKGVKWAANSWGHSGPWQGRRQAHRRPRKPEL